MPLLLAESAKLSNDLVQRGVIETILEESPMLRVMPFLEVEGNSFKYNQENTLGGASFYSVNAQWTEATATFTQKTSNLAILGGDADVDNFIQRTRSTIQDQRAIQTQLKALLTASAHYVESGESAFGRQVMHYDGIPVLVSDFLTDTETADNGTGSTFSSMWALHFSPADGLTGQAASRSAASSGRPARRWSACASSC